MQHQRNDKVYQNSSYSIYLLSSEVHFMKYNFHFLSLVLLFLFKVNDYFHKGTRPKVYRCDGQMCAMASQVNKMQDYVKIIFIAF